MAEVYRRMTLAVLVVSTLGGAAKMIQLRRPGRTYAVLCALTLVERTWLLWHLGTSPVRRRPVAVGIDAATLALASLLSARTRPAGDHASPWGTMAGSSTPAYPQIAGLGAGLPATLLVAACTAAARHRNARGLPGAFTGGIVDGLAHLRGAFVASVLHPEVSESFTAVTQRLSEAAAVVGARQLAAAAAAERERLYGVIHDHTLYGLEQIAGSEPPDVETARKIARVEEERLRLRLGVAEPDGQVPWAALALEFGGNGPEVRVRVSDEAQRLVWDRDMLASVLVAVREALRNVVKHASAGTATVDLRCTDGAVVVEIVDDGVGFDPPAVDLGYGLPHRLRASMAAIGGTATVDSASGRGTRVVLAVPR